MGRPILFVLAGLTTLGACQSKQRTQLVVEVGSNLAISSELDKVELAITANGKTQHTPYSLVSDYKLPLLVGVVEGGGTNSVEIVTTGYLNGVPIVNETADLSFIEDKSMLLKLFLAAECRGDPCTDPATTCTTGGICRSKAFTSADLTPFDGNTPAERADAAPSADAVPLGYPDSRLVVTDAGQDLAMGSGGGLGAPDSRADRPLDLGSGGVSGNAGNSGNDGPSGAGGIEDTSSGLDASGTDGSPSTGGVSGTGGRTGSGPDASVNRPEISGGNSGPDASGADGSPATDGASGAGGGTGSGGAPDSGGASGALDICTGLTAAECDLAIRNSPSESDEVAQDVSSTNPPSYLVCSAP